MNRARQKLAEQRLTLIKAWGNFCDAFEADKRNYFFFRMPMRAKGSVSAAYKRAIRSGYIDPESTRKGELTLLIENPAPCELFEELEKRARNLQRELPVESKSAKAAETLLDVVAAAKESVRP